MLRRIAAGTSAAVVAAGLAAAPAGAIPLPAAPGAVSSGGDPSTCGGEFVFGPLADVPPLLSGDRACFTVASAGTDTSPARRKSSAPPPVGAPAPETPSGPPPDDSGPGGPGPGDSGPPASPAPPTGGPPAVPDFTPMPAPPAEAPAPTPTTAPAEPRGPAGSVRPPAEAPTRLPKTAVDSRPLTVAGGGSLIAAGLAWIGGARRRRKAGARAD